MVFRGAPSTGKTAAKTRALLESAFMENHRDRLLVIAAGHTSDMDRFLAGNEGLRSRFTTTIDFESYRPSDLRRCTP